MPAERRIIGIPTWKIGWYFRRNILVLLSLVLLGFSGFFYWEAEAYRRSIKRTEADAFQTGDVVTIENVIDGDEVAVKSADGQPGVVRILGIRSFDPVVNDPVIAQYGAACFSYLQVNAVGKKAEITISSAIKTDSEGRLLAYLAILDEADQLQISDLGLDLVEQGLTLVYERFPFEREEAYLAAEQKAQDNQQGLWSNPNAVDRSLALKRDWREEKRQDAEK